jgi:hypothetical protein
MRASASRAYPRGIDRRRRRAAMLLLATITMTPLFGVVARTPLALGRRQRPLLGAQRDMYSSSGDGHWTGQQELEFVPGRAAFLAPPEWHHRAPFFCQSQPKVVYASYPNRSARPRGVVRVSTPSTLARRALKSDDTKKKRAWLSSDGKDWETCEQMQPLKQKCSLPRFQTHNFGCDVELLAAEWNRSRTPGILDIYSCRPYKIWENTNMALAPDPTRPALGHNPNNLSGLVVGWEARLGGWLTDAEPMIQDGRIEAVYLGDELMCLGVPFTNYTAVANTVRRRLDALNSSAFIYSNECSGPFTIADRIFSIPKLPAAVDQISVDIYSTGAGEVSEVQAFCNQSIVPKLRPEQKLVVVMGLFADSNATAAGSREHQELALVEKLNAYWQWAQDEPRIAGLNVWHWLTIDTPTTATAAAWSHSSARGNPATEYSIGAESLPSVIARLDEIRAELDAPPAPSPTLPPIRWHYVNGTLRPYFPRLESDGHQNVSNST